MGFKKPAQCIYSPPLQYLLKVEGKKHTLFRTDNKRREAILLISRKHVGIYECQGFVSREQKTL
jgi:hypothetical protein